MNELIEWLRKEANRNSQMQGEKGADGTKTHTCNRRRTFRHRAHQLKAAATELESLTTEVSELKSDLALLRPVCSAASGGMSKNNYVCPCCDGSGGVTTQQFDEWDKMKNAASSSPTEPT